MNRTSAWARLRIIHPLALLTGTVLVGCYRGGIFYRGPPYGTIEGTVFRFEDGKPLANTEVCTFSRDTVCVRTNAKGRYFTQIAVGLIALRFREPGLASARLDSIPLRAGNRLQLDCGLSDRMALNASCRHRARPPVLAHGVLRETLESRAVPSTQAEVCLYAADTACVQTDTAGRFDATTSAGRVQVRLAPKRGGVRLTDVELPSGVTEVRLECTIPQETFLRPTCRARAVP